MWDRGRKDDAQGENDMTKFKTLRQALIMTAATMGGVLAAALPERAAYAQEAVRAYTIPAQDLDGALRAFAMQSGRDVLYPPALVTGRQSPGATGQMTEERALSAILAGSGLRFQRTPSGGYTLREGTFPGAADSDQQTAVSQLSEVLVQGRRALNADIRRTEDDIQPYVVLSGEELRQSGATNVEAFLFSRLPMNAQYRHDGQAQAGLGAILDGGIDLRGLGTDETLVLVDGRRVPRPIDPSLGLRQGSLAGIPVDQIERIEVLPGTAGGIYGGSATGGVINVILKRDYSGLDLSASYENTSDLAARATDLNVSGGFTFNEGRTRVMLSASRREQEPLDQSDRNELLRRSRDLFLQNNPAAFGSFPISGTRTPNVCAVAAPGSLSCVATGLVLDDGTPLGSNRTFVPVGYAGPYASGANDGGRAFLSNAGAFNTDTAPLALGFTLERSSESLDVRHEFSSNLEAFVHLYQDRSRSAGDFAFTQFLTIAADSIYNPFRQDIALALQTPAFPNSANAETRDARLGVVYRLPFAWSAALEYDRSHAVSNYNIQGYAAPNAAQTAYLASVALRDWSVFPSDPSTVNYDVLQRRTTNDLESTSGVWTLRFGGPVLSVPAGKATINALIERRRDEIGETLVSTTFRGPPTYQWTAPQSAENTAAYIEARLPIFSKSNARPFLQSLDLMTALRHDEYNYHVVGFPVAVGSPDGPFPAPAYADPEFNANSYTIGMAWSPVEDLRFRASLGTGFLPPNLPQFSAVTAPEGAYYPDPQRGGQYVFETIPVTQGGSIDLKPEESETVSIGLVFQPKFLDGLRVSLDYLEIEKTNEIFRPNHNDLVALEFAIPGRVSRGPLTPEDAALGYTAGPVIAIDSTALNLSTSTAHALDFQVDYNVETARWGAWRFYLLGTHLAEHTLALIPGQPAIDDVGFSEGPLEWRGNYGIDWRDGPWALGWNAQYYDSYRLCSSIVATTFPDFCAETETNQGSPYIPSQTYHDVYASYHFAADGSALSDVDVSLTIQNLFDQMPPAIASTSSTAEYSSYGDVRMRRFVLTLRKHF